MESAKSRVRQRTRHAASSEATAYVCARALPKERRKGKGETGEVKEEESEE